MRRSIVRYILLAYVLCLRKVCVPIVKRFPTLDHVVWSGIMTPDERVAYDSIQCSNAKTWIPIRWAMNIVIAARSERRIQSDYYVLKLFELLQRFRGGLGTLLDYDSLNCPLVYTQVVNMAVWLYFLVCLVGRQYLDPEHHKSGSDIDLYIPFFTIMEFLFYMGWLHVALVHLNPMGEDDDDFEMNSMLDRNMTVSIINFLVLKIITLGCFSRRRRAPHALLPANKGRLLGDASR